MKFLLLFILIGAGIWYLNPELIQNITSSIKSQIEVPGLITVTSPKSYQKISSPLTITGQARGQWYFEGTAPVRLEDSSGQTIAKGHIAALEAWTTENWIRFSGELEFETPETQTGTLILENTNQSGFPENPYSLSLPVKF